jgi:nucleoside-diphosphate-sugar epimerase
MPTAAYTPSKTLETDPCHIAIFGATGSLGLELVQQAVDHGHRVSVLCRNPAKLVHPAVSGGDKAGLPFKCDQLRVFKGDVTNASDVNAVFVNDGAPITCCIIALGGQPSLRGGKNRMTLTVGTQNVIAALKANGISRVAVVTSMGTTGTSKCGAFSRRCGTQISHYALLPPNVRPSAPRSAFDFSRPQTPSSRCRSTSG